MLTIRSAQMQQMGQASPGRQMIQPCQDSKTWIEVRLVDSDNLPVPGARYKVQLPDGSVMEGNLDDEGKIRFDSIIPGSCSVTFPEFDAREWQQD